MIRNLLITTVCTLLPLSAASTYGINQLGEPQSPHLAKGVALGGTSGALVDDGHSLSNPAKMAYNKKTSFAAGLTFESVEYGMTTESSFNIPYIAMSIPIGSAGNLSLAYFQKFGYDFHYKELLSQDTIKTTAIEDDIVQSWSQTSIEGAVAEIVPSWSITLFDRFAIGVNYHHPMGATQIIEENEQWSKNTSITYQADAQLGYIGTSVQYSGKGWGVYLGYQPEYTVIQLFSGDITLKENLQDTSLYYNDVNKNQSEVLFTSEREQKFASHISFGGAKKFGDRHTVSLEGSFQGWSGIEAYSPLSVVNEKKMSQLNDAYVVGAGYQMTPSRRNFDFYLKRVSYRVGVQYGQLYIDETKEFQGSFGFGFPLGTRRISHLDVSFYYNLRGPGAESPDFEEHTVGGAVSFTGFGDWGKSSRRYR